MVDELPTKDSPAKNPRTESIRNPEQATARPGHEAEA